MLDLVAAGPANRAIADRLDKSGKTVRNPVSTIFEKLGVNSRAQAIIAALDG